MRSNGLSAFSRTSRESGHEMERARAPLEDNQYCTIRRTKKANRRPILKSELAVVD
jgi:hypothetical protein